MAGFWIIGGKRLISSVLHHCVTCRKLRGKMEEQVMADLPPERLNIDPPFTYVGLDVFGPWMVRARRTRGGHAESKRWAILFTCMSVRAVHIEIIESMDTSSCINALRRFFAIRGPAKQLRSDCGTNFVGASKELGLSKLQQEERILRYLGEQNCSWEFNPPHSSHRGGSWERMIGVARRILDCILLREHAPFSHEVLCTLMAEVSAIINARPLIPVSTDPQSPFILTPAMLLTQKGAVPSPPGELMTGTFFSISGDKYRPLPMSSGSDGKGSTYQPSRVAGSGMKFVAICKKATSSYWRITKLLVIRGQWQWWLLLCIAKMEKYEQLI